MSGRPALLDDLFQSPVLMYRVLGLVAAIAFVIGAFAEQRYSPRGDVDLLFLIGLIIGFLVISAVSLKPQVSPDTVENGWFMVLLFGVVGQAVHLYGQNLSFEVALQSFVVITAASATLRKRYYLRVFLGLSMLNVIAVSLVLPNPEVTPALFGLQLVTYSLFM